MQLRGGILDRNLKQKARIIYQTLDQTLERILDRVKDQIVDWTLFKTELNFIELFL